MCDPYGGLSILLYDVISLPDVTSYDKYVFIPFFVMLFTGKQQCDMINQFPIYFILEGSVWGSFLFSFMLFLLLL